jgi:phenylpyruvate tautomerase PptA (4-oxalocrotonate tautomerase family)
MPTYHCIAPAGLLDKTHKAAIAEAITRIHAEVTGAPSFFAQVIFREVAPGDHFIGGVVWSSAHIFVHGFVRAGRSVADLRKIATDIVACIASLTNLPPRMIWAYLTDIPASQMVEFGHVLPEPGQEARWLAGLPQDDADHMRSIGFAL